MIKIVLFLSFLVSAAGFAPKAQPQVRVGKPPVSAASGQFKSYKEWKNEQILYWRSRGQIEMARDLTVADYFAGYLTKQKDQTSAIKEVSARLNAEEVAELMMIYANSVFGGHSPQLPTRAENLSAK